MITPAQIYWLTRVDEIKGIGIAMAIIGLVLGIVLFGPRFDDNLSNSFRNGVRTAQMWFFAHGIVGLLLALFVPSEKDMSAIIVIPKIANGESVAEIGDGVKTLVIEWLEELRPAKKGEGSGRGQTP